MFNKLSFKKKKTKIEQSVPEILTEENVDILGQDASLTGNRIANGVPSLKDLIAPASFDRSSPDHMQVGDKFVRNFIIAGFPRQIAVGWANALYNYEGDLDLALHINPTDERTAMDELTSKITQFEAQLATEMEKGSNRNITRLRSQIEDLYQERIKAEQNYISLFSIQMIMNLFTNNLEQLNKETQLLENSLKGRKIKLMANYLRQDMGYKSALPFGRSWLNRNYRNFNSEALTACYPFYNAEISHPTGVFVGVNNQTQTPIYIDFYDRKLLNNGNTTVFGTAGSGKTFMVSLLTMRSILKQIRTAIVDPEGEYKIITQALGGVNIEIKPGGVIPNPFDLEDEEEVDDYGYPTGRKVVRLQEKISDLLNLIGVMCGGLEREQISLLSLALADTYKDFGMTESPESLYTDDVILNDEGEFIHHGQKKVMPTLSDFHERLVLASKQDGNECLIPVANSLQMFIKTGVYGLFDTQTSPELVNMKAAPVITFDVSSLEDKVLRPIGMYIALTWCWEKFAKKDLAIKKRIVCDEAWMLVKKEMAGSEFTAQFLENTARRIRKRNGSLLVASQNFKEFADNPQGQAVLTNTTVNIFLRQNATDIDDVQSVFKLSDGERNFMLSATKGNFLLKMQEESTTGYAMAFDYERFLIEKKTAAMMKK
jgi:type IV secretory pathway VirB4 component